MHTCIHEIMLSLSFLTVKHCACTVCNKCATSQFALTCVFRAAAAMQVSSNCVRSRSKQPRESTCQSTCIKTRPDPDYAGQQPRTAFEDTVERPIYAVSPHWLCLSNVMEMLYVLLVIFAWEDGDKPVRWGWLEAFITLIVSWHNKTAFQLYTNHSLNRMICYLLFCIMECCHPFLSGYFLSESNGFLFPC